MTESARRTMWAHSAMVLFAGLVSTSFTLTPVALAHVSALTLNAMRFGVAAAVLLIVTRSLTSLRTTTPAWRVSATGGVLAAYFTAMAIALQYATPISASAIFALVPLLTVGSSRLLLGSRAPSPRPEGALIALLGALIVIFRGNPANALALRLGPGELIFLAGCICYAFYAPLVRLNDDGEPPIVQSTWTVTAAAILLFAAAVPDLASTEWSRIPASTWLVVALLAAGPTAACFYLSQYASRYLPPTLIGAYAYAIPAFVVVQESLLGMHWPAAWAWTGGAIILLGLLVLFIRPEP